jgi:hypothetical protein
MTSPNNSQDDGKNAIKRFEFVYKGTTYKFVLNPEEYTQIEPSRITVTQTKAGAWVDDFGMGIATINFKGTTGFKNGTNDPRNGFLKFKELRDLIRRYYTHTPGTIVSQSEELVFHNYTDAEHWVVFPKTFQLLRSVSRPTLYLYEVQLVCLRRADQPAPTYTDSTPIEPKIRKVTEESTKKDDKKKDKEKDEASTPATTAPSSGGSGSGKKSKIPKSGGIGGSAGSGTSSKSGGIYKDTLGEDYDSFGGGR